MAHIEKRNRGGPRRWVDPQLGRTLTGEWANRWLAAVEPTLKPKTAASYRSLLRSRILPAFGAVPLAAVKPLDVQRWIGSMESEGLSASRVRQAHVVLSQLLDAAVRDEMIVHNPAARAKLPRIVRTEAPYFEPSVVEAIAEAMPPPADLFVRLQGTLGLRFGEAAALRRRSVDVLRRRLRVEESLAEVGGTLIFGATKSHAARAVPLPPSLLEALEHHLEDVGPHPEALLFTAARGGPLRYSRFYATRWRPTLRALSLPMVGIHVLRHSAAARLIGAGASPKAVQTILGHASAAFTLTRYGHLFDSDLDDLAASLDLVRPQRGPTPIGKAPRAAEQGL